MQTLVAQGLKRHQREASDWRTDRVSTEGQY